MRLVKGLDKEYKSISRPTNIQDILEGKVVENLDSILSKSSEDGSIWFRSHRSKELWFNAFGISYITPENLNSAFEIRLGTSSGILYGSHFLLSDGQRYATYVKLCTDGFSAGLKAPLRD